jgi:transcription antitermination factor NusG
VNVEVIVGSFIGLSGAYIETNGIYRVMIQVNVLNSFTNIKLPFNPIKEVLG